MTVRVLFTNCPRALVDLQWMSNPSQRCYSLMAFVNLDDRGTGEMFLEDFLNRFTEAPEYNRLFFHFTLTMWEDFLLALSGHNPGIGRVEIHMFCEKEQRPFMIWMENNEMFIRSYSPYHIAFFNERHNEYEFDVEKYMERYPQLRPLETHSVRSILRDIDEYGFFLRA